MGGHVNTFALPQALDDPNLLSPFAAGTAAWLSAAGGQTLAAISNML